MTAPTESPAPRPDTDEISARVLIVEDSESDTILLERELRRSGMHLASLRVETEEAFREALENQTWDAVISDYTLPRFNGLKALSILRESGRDLPFILVSGTMGEEIAVAAMRAGAQDFFLKGNIRRLPAALQRELTEADIRHRQRKAEQMVDRSREFYMNLLEGFPALVWRSRPDGSRDYFNQRWLSFTGRSLDQELEDGWLEGVHPQDQAYYRNSFQDALKHQRPFEVEFRLRHADGEYRWIADVARPFRSLEESFGGYIGSCFDVTRRHTVEQELRIAHQEAEAARRSQAEFLANMSHEIRTPLNGIIGMLHLAQGTNVPAEYQEYINMAQDSARNLLSLFNAILNFSKLAAGSLTSHPEAFRLSDSLHSVVGLFEPKAQAKGLSLILAIDPEAPEDLFGDIINLRSLLGCLLDNAVKFTHQGSIRMEVQPLSRGAEQVELLFRITDTGIGIPADRQRDIFNPFTQADGSLSRTYGGAGLGLAIASHLARLLNGCIDVESTPGLGSIFGFSATFRLRGGEEALPEPFTP